MDVEEQGQPEHFQSFPQQHPLDAEGIDPSALYIDSSIFLSAPNKHIGNSFVWIALEQPPLQQVK